VSDKPLNLRIVEAVIARLQEILPANGYTSDAGLRVGFADRAADDSLPCLVVWEGEEEAENADGNHRSMLTTLTVRVDAIVSADQECTGRALSYLRADVKKALLKYDEPSLRDEMGVRFGGPVGYVGATPLPREDGADAEGVSLTFRVRFKEGYGDPYAVR
jgi:hypothetical protein